MMVDDWLHTHTFHHSQFQDIWELVCHKKAQGLTISVCLPTCNAAATIGRTLVILKSELMTCYPLVDDVVVIDAGSTDTTCDIAMTFGAHAYQAQDILLERRRKHGKDDGARYAAEHVVSDILVSLDSNILHFQPYMVAGLVGPLLYHPHIQYVNAFYDHPLASLAENQPVAQEHFSEAFARTLFARFFPELNAIIHPLSRAYAVRRAALAGMPFTAGHGDAIFHLLSVYRRYGLEGIGQVDLELTDLSAIVTLRSRAGFR